ncbi:MAG: hypothetical protein F4X71_03220, partial [Cenarchaeum sp. SB0662_bin_33]|nr:hypothetical protein [Cenarchaeum sp. SB0662_bin_33]
MADIELLKQILGSEGSGRVARRLSMMMVLFKLDIAVTATAVMCSCDPRTVTLWYGRLPRNTNAFDEIRKALADMPRS